MTTWTTFETIDETPRFTEFYVDRLGVHQYHNDDRVRFVFTRGSDRSWNCEDLQAEDDQTGACYSSMRNCVQWMAARVLYGA